jgi:hypothetical protein
MDSFKIKKALFLGEQDGTIERELKAKLIDCFRSNPNVSLAYLVRVSYTETLTPQVALCIRGGKESAAELVGCAGKAFKSLFRPTVHLDIWFLTEDQLNDIEHVAMPFYVA